MADSKFCKGCQRGEEDVNAVAWCSDCSELVCKVCARVHGQMSPPHKVVPMKEIQQFSSSLFQLSKICEIHPDEKIVLYCCQHDKVICDSCVTVSHQNCMPITSIEKAARGVKEGTAISDLERRLDNLSHVTENILSHSKATLEDLTKSRNSIKKRVSEIKQKCIAHLQKLEADIHKDIDNKYKHCNETVSRNKDNIQSSADSLSTWKNDLKSLKQHASDIPLFQAVKYLDAKTHSKELEIREIQTAIVPTLTYHPPEFSITKILPDLGMIMVDNVPVTLPALDIDQQGQFYVTDKKKFSLTNSFHTAQLGDGVCIGRGCFIPGERLLLSEHNNDTLIVCKLDGSNPKVINLDCKPRSITLYDNDRALVSVNETYIQIIDLTSSKLGGTIRVGSFCSGITSIKDKIWVRNELKTVTLIDINGKVMFTTNTTFTAWDICANKDGNVYCTTSENDKVFVVTSNGQEREIYSSPDLKNTHGVAVGNNGDVFVAGLASNNIHRISHDGQTHDIILSEHDGINKPTSLSYNCKTGELLVINNYYKTVNIYQKK